MGGVFVEGLGMLPLRMFGDPAVGGRALPGGGSGPVISFQPRPMATQDTLPPSAVRIAFQPRPTPTQDAAPPSPFQIAFQPRPMPTQDTAPSPSPGAIPYVPVQPFVPETPLTPVAPSAYNSGFVWTGQGGSPVPWPQAYIDPSQGYDEWSAQAAPDDSQAQSADGWSTPDDQLDEYQTDDSWGALLDWTPIDTSLPLVPSAAPASSSSGGGWFSNLLTAIPALTTSYARIQASRQGNTQAALGPYPGMTGGYMPGAGGYPGGYLPGGYSPSGSFGPSYSTPMSSTTKLLLIGAVALGGLLLVMKKKGA